MPNGEFLPSVSESFTVGNHPDMARGWFYIHDEQIECSSNLAEPAVTVGRGADNLGSIHTKL